MAVWERLAEEVGPGLLVRCLSVAAAGSDAADARPVAFPPALMLVPPRLKGH